MRRYAEGTTVSVNASQGEIAGILMAHGVRKQGWMSGEEGDELMFELGGHSFRFQILRPTLQGVQSDWDAEHAFAAAGQRANLDWGKKLDAEWRRRWRANVLLLKAKLEFIDSGDTTLERELLPYMLTAGGQTVAELVVAGKLPMLAAEAGR